MRHKRTESIAIIIDQYLKGLGIDKKMKEAKIISLWEDTVGRSVARVTTSIYIKNKTLFVKLRSSVVRSELMMLKKGIIIALNDKVEDQIINDIILH